MKIEITSCPFGMCDKHFANIVSQVTLKPVTPKPSKCKGFTVGFTVGDFEIYCGTITCPKKTPVPVIDSIIKTLQCRACECDIKWR